MYNNYKGIFFKLQMLFFIGLFCLSCSRGHKEGVVAVVNGEEITSEDFLDFYNSRPRVADWTSPGGKLDPNQVLEALIEKVLMAQEGIRKGIDKLPGYDQEIEKIREREMVNVFLDKSFDPKIHITDEEVLSDIPEYQKKEVKFARICVLDEDDAKEIKKALDEGGDFSQLAKERSIGLEAEKGGVMDFLSPHRGIYHKDVVKEIFELPIGEVSAPQRIREGFALFKPIEERPLNSDEMTQVMQYHRTLLFRDKKQTLIKDLLDKAKRENAFFINETAIKQIAGGEVSPSSPDLLMGEFNDYKLYWRELKGSLPVSVKGQRALWEDQNMLYNVVVSRLNQRIIITEAKRAGFEHAPELEKEMKRYMQDILGRQLLMQEVEEKINITDDVAREYYQRHINEYAEPEMFKINHILIKDEEKAKEVNALIKKGKDFADLAERYSEYKPTAMRGGDLGFMQRGTTGMGRVFEEVAFSLKEGEISEPVKTPFGYQIIRVQEIRGPRIKPFAEVKEEIVKVLQNDKRGVLFKDFLAALKKKARIEINNIVFDEIKKEL